MSKYYVSMTDKFMSGWGHARGRTNKLVIECDTYDEALVVQSNAEARSEMKYVAICERKPYYTKDRYFVSFHSKQDYKNWFIPNYFKDQL